MKCNETKRKGRGERGEGTEGQREEETYSLIATHAFIDHVRLVHTENI